MLEALITLLVVVCIIGIAWWAIQQLNPPAPVRMVAVVLVAILAIIVLLRLVPGFSLG